MFPILCTLQAKTISLLRFSSIISNQWWDVINCVLAQWCTSLYLLKRSILYQSYKRWFHEMFSILCCYIMRKIQNTDILPLQQNFYYWLVLKEELQSCSSPQLLKAEKIKHCRMAIYIIQFSNLFNIRSTQ